MEKINNILDYIYQANLDQDVLVELASSLGEGGDVSFDLKLLSKTIYVIESCEDEEDVKLTELIIKLKEIKPLLNKILS